MSSDVPEGWVAGQVLDFFQLQRGHDLPVQDRQPGPVPIIASNGVVGFHDQSSLAGPGVVTGRSGSIGNVSFVEGAYWPLNTALYVRDFKGSDPEFVYYFLQNFPLKDHATGTGVPTLNRNDVHAVEVVFPPLDEQRRIAEVLRSVDEAIAANEQALVQFQRTRDAIRDTHFETQKQKGRPQTLGSLCDITKLAGFEYTKHIQYGESDEIIAVRGLNIKDGRLVLDDIKTISRATSKALPRSCLRSGDLVMSYVGTIGEVAKIDEDERFHLAPNVALLRCGQNVLPDYILHFLYSRTGRDQIGRYVSTSSQQSLSMSKIRAFEIALPSLDEQRRVTGTIATFSASLVSGMETQSQLLAHKATLMSDLLSGRVRVTA